MLLVKERLDRMETNPTAAVESQLLPSFCFYLFSTLLGQAPDFPGQGIMHPISANWLLTWHCYRNSRRRPLPGNQVKIHLTGL